MASSLAQFQAFAKDFYDTEMVNWLVNKDRPFQGKLKKTLGSGDAWLLPVGLANPQGAAADLPNAQTASNQTTGGNIQGVRWVIPWGDYNAEVSINDKIIAMSRDNVGAFFEDRKMEIDRLYETFGDIMETYLLGDSGHSVTPGTFTISAGVCTLANPDDIVFIEKGMILNASANPGTSTSDALLGSGSSGFVVAVNQNAGTFTVSTTSGGSAGTPTGWTGTMYAFRQGDFGGTASPTVILTGMAGWVPAADPSSTAFYGIDRTQSMTPLSGVRLTSAETTGLGLEQRVKRLATRMVGRGKGPGPSDVFMNPETWQSLADSLESRGNRPLDGKIGTFNYQKIQLAAGGKMVDVWANKYVPIKKIWAVNFDYLELKTLSGFPAVVNGDGLDTLRASNANNYAYRLTCYPAFGIRAVGYQGYVTAP